MYTKEIILIIVCFSYLINYSAAQVSCGGRTCGSTDSCCNDINTGYRCYNSQTSACVSNGEGATVLCGAGLAACGTTCYNSSSYECEAGDLLCGYRNGEAIMACNGACYNPDTYECCNKKLYQVGKSSCFQQINMTKGGSNTPLFCSPFTFTECTKGQWCCGDDCYNPSTQTCLNSIICPISNQLCGSTCFDPAVHECCNGQLFAVSTSVCSLPAAACCTTTCSSTIITGISSTFTVGSSSDCNMNYINTNFPGALNCPSTEGSCYGGNCSQVVSCGSNPMWWDRCYQSADSCSGTNYICGGGNFATSVTQEGECVSTVQENGYNATLSDSESTSYQKLPNNYKGEVCCWCISTESATSAIVPNIQSCTVSYMAANEYFVGSECMVWSAAEFATKDLVCGLPD